MLLLRASFECLLSCVALSLALIGFVILGTIDVVARKHVAYFATFLLCMGVSDFDILIVLIKVTRYRLSRLLSWLPLGTPIIHPANQEEWS